MNRSAQILQSPSANSAPYAASSMHPVEQKEMLEREWILNLLAINAEQDLFFTPNILKELKNFAGFIFGILPAFSSGILMRKIIRRNKRLNYILQFEELQSVRSNIEKGSFAYDTVLFGLTTFQVLQNKSHLANLVCLAILFGDEFIDGIAIEFGKENIQSILNSEQIDFSLQYRVHEGRLELYYEFDIRTVLPDEILKTRNQKYGINYNDFYDHLLFLLTEMNLHLNKLSKETGVEAAVLICSVCNKCFDTYKMDIAKFDLSYGINELLDYQKKKDDDIIQVLLSLRAVLLGKNLNQYQPFFSNWSTMVRSMQIYDDMQDVSFDCNYQMNFLCYFAKNYFKKEWCWLQENLEGMKQHNGLENHLLVCLYMPASVALSMQYAKHIVQSELNWVQKKITGYLWKKNWFGWSNKTPNCDVDLFKKITGDAQLSLSNKLEILEQQILSIKDALLSEEQVYAFIVDIVFFDKELLESFFASISRKDRYFLQNGYFDFPVYKKAALVKRWLLNQKKVI